MKILDDILSALSTDVEVKDIRQGVFQTAVHTRNCGLASTPHDFSGHEHGASVVSNAGGLLELTAEELAALSKSAKQNEAAIGIATINSLLDVDESQCVELNAADLIEEKGKGKKVAIIGHFPFIPKLQKKVGELWVIEKNPHEGDYPEDKADELLPQADVVGITGVTLINQTFDSIASLCRKDAFVVMLGGTTPLSPVLFDYGIDAVSGTMVTHPGMVLNAVSQGATFRQIKGRKSLTMMKNK